MSTYRKPGWFTKNVFNRIVATTTRLGIGVWGSRVLRVRGRRSGEWRSTPVNLLSFQEDRYLIAPRGQTQWVRNLRVSGTGGLQLGRKIESFRAVELSDVETPAVLRAYLKRWKAEMGVFFGGVDASAADEELVWISPEHPVFKIDRT